MDIDLERLVREVVGSYFDQEKKPGIPVGVSNRHVHLSGDHFAALFGHEEQGTRLRDLSQPGQFALEETVTLIGPRGIIERVRILGPTRAETQVEILMADSFSLGIPAVVRDSGDLQDTPGLIVAGPSGVVKLGRGVIVARRHVHANPAEAGRLGITDRELIALSVGGIRGLVFQDVLVRVNPGYSLEFHVDIEEANAAQLKNGDLVSLA